MAGRGGERAPLLMRESACSTEMGSPFTDVIQSITLEMLSNGDMHLPQWSPETNMKQGLG